MNVEDLMSRAETLAEDTQSFLKDLDVYLASAIELDEELIEAAYDNSKYSPIEQDSIYEAKQELNSLVEFVSLVRAEVTMGLCALEELYLFDLDEYRNKNLGE